MPVEFAREVNQPTILTINNGLKQELELHSHERSFSARKFLHTIFSIERKKLHNAFETVILTQANNLSIRGKKFSPHIT